MQQSFSDQSHAARIVFGRGSLARVADEPRALGCSRALVLSGPVQKAAGQQLSQRLGKLSAGVFADAVMHTPVEVTQKADTVFGVKQTLVARSNASKAAKPSGARPSTSC